MCLPLKAAVVSVLKIWDVCEVRSLATELVSQLTRTSQRTVQLNQEFIKHKEKLERLLKITNTHQGEIGLSDNLRGRLEEVASYVFLRLL